MYSCARYTRCLRNGAGEYVERMGMFLQDTFHARQEVPVFYSHVYTVILYSGVHRYHQSDVQHARCEDEFRKKKRWDLTAITCLFNFYKYRSDGKYKGHL